MKTIRYTTNVLSQREQSVSTTTAPMATMTKNLFGIGAMSKTQAVENGLTVLTLPQLENMAVTLISHSMKPQENSDFYY